MSLFQPTNIIPSTLAPYGNSAISASDNVKIQWQMNGTSALQYFEADIFTNDADSALVHSTGCIPKSSYSTDVKGNPQPTVYEPASTTWSSWGLSNGNSYKLRIIQMGENVTVQRGLNDVGYSLFTDDRYCIYNTENHKYYHFNPPEQFAGSTSLSIDIMGSYLIFNYDASLTNNTRLLFTTYTMTDSAGSDVLLNTSGSTAVLKPEIIFPNISPVFYAASSLIVTYSPGLPNTVTTVNLSVAAIINGGVAQWRRYVLAKADGTTVDDTGQIFRSSLNYSYKGLVDGVSYALTGYAGDNYGRSFSGVYNFTASFTNQTTSAIPRPTACIDEATGKVTIPWRSEWTFAQLSRGYVYAENIDTGIQQYLGSILTSDSIVFYSMRSCTQYRFNVFFGAEGVWSYYRSSPDICHQFRSYYLYEATQDADDDNVFHIINTWRFGNNYSAGAIKNGNSPNFLTNFTKYPHRQASTPAAKSGTLTALLSNFGDLNAYEDTAVQMDALYDLSLSQNHIFLKDTKGNLYEVHTSAPISQTINTKTKIQEVSVSVPWQEVADASSAILLS